MVFRKYRLNSTEHWYKAQDVLSNVEMVQNALTKYVDSYHNLKVPDTLVINLSGLNNEIRYDKRKLKIQEELKYRAYIKATYGDVEMISKLSGESVWSIRKNIRKMRLTSFMNDCIKGKFPPYNIDGSVSRL